MVVNFRERCGAVRSSGEQLLSFWGTLLAYVDSWNPPAWAAWATCVTCVTCESWCRALVNWKGYRKHRKQMDYLFVCVCVKISPSSGNFTVFSSRKLASASWSPSCLSKVLGGLESPIAWNLIRNYPSPSLPGWLVHKQFGRGSIPPLKKPSACRRRQQIQQHPHPQHHCVFMPS